jgi:anti-sigma B factor antagonist
VNPGTLAEIESESKDNHAIIRVRGEIDLSNVEELRVNIRRALGRAKSVAIDLSAVEYLDSQGLHMLVDLTRALDREGIELSVFAPADSLVGQLFEITSMDTVLRLLPDAPN